MSIFSTRLYEARISSGLTQDEIASLIPTTQSSYSRIENGIQEPNLMQLKRIGEILNVSIDYLLDVDNEFFNNQLNKEIAENIKIIYENYKTKYKEFKDEE